MWAHPSPDKVADNSFASEAVVRWFEPPMHQCLLLEGRFVILGTQFQLCLKIQQHCVQPEAVAERVVIERQSLCRASTIQLCCTDPILRLLLCSSPTFLLIIMLVY